MVEFTCLRIGWASSSKLFASIEAMELASNITHSMDPDIIEIEEEKNEVRRDGV
jgi:hypothetical protein